MNRKKGFFFLLITLLATAAGCLEFPILMLEMTVFGFGNPDSWAVGQDLVHWFLTSAAWIIISVTALLYVEKKRLPPGNDRSQPANRLSRLRLLLILCVITVGIIYMSSTWEFRFKPLVEWQHLNARFGNAGIWAFSFQYLYYLAESLLITVITTAGQQAGEALFPSKAADKIPWGGICCAMTWGLLHSLSKDWNTAFFCIFLSLLFGIAHVLAGKKLRYTYPAIALIFLL